MIFCLGLDTDYGGVLLLQLAPFPFDLVLRELRRYPNAEVMWVQVNPLPLPPIPLSPLLSTSIDLSSLTLDVHQPVLPAKAPYTTLSFVPSPSRIKDWVQNAIVLEHRVYF